VLARFGVAKGIGVLGYGSIGVGLELVLALVVVLGDIERLNI
jgi:hypothetical protein